MANRPSPHKRADVVVITKIDLAAVVEFDEDLARNNIRGLRPDIQIFDVSSKTGYGIDEFLDYLRARRVDSRTAAAV
jgi:hydrogenase nickel incorporation protein HypB